MEKVYSFETSETFLR